MTDDPFDTIARLRAEGRPFAVATVLRTAGPTAARAGAKAMVTEDGRILGHVGGGCVAAALRSAAAEAIAAGEPRLVSVRPGDTGAPVPAGVAVHESGCPSRGTVDLLIEPWRLPPLVAVIGATPIADAILAHARLAGLRAEAASADGLAALSPRREDVVVVATQGAGDKAVLRAALGSEAGLVQMIASRRKAEVLIRRLAAEGLDPDRLARLKAPAGLDIGAVDPHEIALSVLAEIVAARRRPAASAAEAETRARHAV